LDIVGDIRALNELARKSIKAGMIILGGGVCKHQIANAMLIVRIVFSSSGLSLIMA
jgi:deoxyhypusine synthase